ncbi:MAG: thymidine phosphorylase, partial [Inhella sp.]
AGLQALVMDVKVGNGAFADTPAMARDLAESIVAVGNGAGMRTRALITDMNQVLGRTAGNALEVQEAIDYLTGRDREPRQHEITLQLCGQMLVLGGLAADEASARGKLQQALDSGAAAEKFAQMVALLGGPKDVLKDAEMASAPVVRAVPALRDGFIASQDTRAIGIAVIELGGGRRLASDPIDTRVGFAAVQPLGTALRAGEAMAVVHAANEVEAEAAVAAYQAALVLSDAAPAATPLVAEVIG